MALFLVYVQIFYRVWLIREAVMERLADARAAGEASDDPAAALDAMADLTANGGPLVPGSLGNPLLFILAIPALVIARRLMRKGYRTALHAFLVYQAVRAVMIVARGPWGPEAWILLTLMAIIAALLLAPASRVWFDARGVWRRQRAAADA